MEHAHAWGWDRKGGRNLCYKPRPQNQAHEHQSIEKSKNASILSLIHDRQSPLEPNLSVVLHRYKT
jgi:hypothetical protein